MPTFAGMSKKLIDGFLSKDEASLYCSLSLRSIDYARERGELIFYKHDKRVLFKKADLDRWMEQFRASTDLDRLVDETVAEVLGQ